MLLKESKTYDNSVNTVEAALGLRETDKII